MNSRDGNSFQKAQGTGGQPTMYSHRNSNPHSQNSSDRSPNTSFQKWGSPATAPSYNNVRFSPHQKYTNNTGQGYHDQRQFSPRFSGPRQFRTPQPVQRHSTPHGRSWTGDFNNRFNKSPAKRFHNFKNRRFDVNCNPGGSNDIDQYYHPTMLQDPWQDLLACPINQAPPPTT